MKRLNEKIIKIFLVRFYILSDYLLFSCRRTSATLYVYATTAVEQPMATVACPR